MGGPLDGVRVVDLTGDSGRFATKLLAECGASVARLGQGGSGPTMQAPDAARLGGLKDVVRQRERPWQRSTPDDESDE